MEIVIRYYGMCKDHEFLCFSQKDSVVRVSVNGKLFRDIQKLWCGAEKCLLQTENGVLLFDYSSKKVNTVEQGTRVKCSSAYVKVMAQRDFCKNFPEATIWVNQDGTMSLMDAERCGENDFAIAI